jgi:hypothetical protein
VRLGHTLNRPTRQRHAPAGSYEGKTASLRAEAAAFRARVEALGPVAEDSFPAQFAREQEQKEFAAARQAADDARAAAQRARENPLEHTILAATRRKLEDAGFTTHRLQGGLFTSPAGNKVVLGESGWTDLLVELSGARVAWLELKTADGRLTLAQESWHARAKKRGQIVLVAHSAAEALALVQQADASSEVPW